MNHCFMYLVESCTKHSYLHCIWITLHAGKHLSVGYRWNGIYDESLFCFNVKLNFSGLLCIQQRRTCINFKYYYIDHSIWFHYRWLKINNIRKRTVQYRRPQTKPTIHLFTYFCTNFPLIIVKYHREIVKRVDRITDHFFL